MDDFGIVLMAIYETQSGTMHRTWFLLNCLHESLNILLSQLQTTWRFRTHRTAFPDS